MTRIAPQRLFVGVLATLLLASTHFLTVAVLAQGGAISAPGPQYGTVGAAGSLVVTAADIDGDPSNVPVFSVTSLPLGLTPGAPQLAAGGTATVTISGSLTTAGIYPVKVTVTDGAAPPQTVVFTWNVSEWQVGDVFAGVGGRTYLRFSSAGVPGAPIVIQSHPAETSFTTGDTTGCAVDWRTGDLYTTNFSSGTYRIAGAPSADGTHATLDFYDSDRPEDVGGQTGLYVDQLPESVVLSHNGFFIGHADGYFGVDNLVPTDQQNRPLYGDASNGGCDCMIGTNGNPILDIDGNQFSAYNEYAVGLYFVDAAANVMTDGAGAYLYYGSKDSNGMPYILNNPSPGDPYWDRFAVLPGASALEPFLEKGQDVPYLGQDGKPVHTRLQWGADIQVRDLQGTRLSKEDGIYGIQGTDWVDLASDQRTLFYTSEYGIVYRYDLQTHTQLPPFGYLGDGVRAFALRILPPGDGTGGVLVAANQRVVRLDGHGQIVQEYQVPAEFQATEGNPQWFAMSITPDAKDFWTASLVSGNLYEFDIVTGQQLQGPVATGAPPYFLGGVCVKLEYTAAQEICGNSLDDDGDGLVDENCTALPICSQDPGNPACNHPPVTPDWGADELYEDTTMVRPEPGANLFLDLVDDPDCGPTSCDADNLQVTILGAPAHGTMTLTVNGTPYPVTDATVAAGLSFAYDSPFHGNPGGTDVVETYTPDPDYCGGSETIPYRVTDPKGASAEGVYTIRLIMCVNDPPVASPDTATTNEDTPATVPVVANDHDAEGNTITVASVTQPAHGAVTFSATSVTYTPAPDFFGTDTFTYTATDNQPVDPNAPPQGTPGESTATVTITVNPVNDPPSFTKGPGVTVPEDAGLRTVAGWATNLSPGPANEAGQTLTFLVTATNPALFSVAPAVSPGGALTFQSAANAHGSATVSVRLQDSGGTANGGIDTSAVQTFTISVTPVNDPPGAVNDAYTVNGQTLVVPASLGVLRNDTDIDGDTLTAAVLSGPGGGALLLNPDGSFTYTANAGTTADAFTYTASDGHGGTATATVTLSISANRPPVCSAAVAVPSTLWPPNHQMVPIAIQRVTDPDGNPITLTITGIRQDEPTNTDGDGDTAIDGTGVGTPQARVRAERTGDPKHPGNGRVYHIRFTASDGLTSCSGDVTVGVPHDQGHGPALDDGPIYDSTVPYPPVAGDGHHGRDDHDAGRDDDRGPWDCRGDGNHGNGDPGRNDKGGDKNQGGDGWMKDSDWQHGRDSKDSRGADWTRGWDWNRNKDAGPKASEDRGKDVGKKNVGKDDKKGGR